MLYTRHMRNRAAALLASVALAVLVPGAARAAAPITELAVCTARAHDIELTFVESRDRLMGNRLTVFAVSNQAAESCVTRGHPAVVLLAEGAEIEAEQVDDCCSIVNTATPPTILLLPGNRAYFGIVDLSCPEGDDDVRTADTVGVTLPGDTDRLSVPVPTGIQLCPDGRFGVTALRGWPRKL